MVPRNFELLDSKKYFELYYNGELPLISHLNYYKYERGGELNRMVADLLGYIYQKEDGRVINRYASEKSLRDADFMKMLILTDGNKKMLDNLFGNGKNTTRLGEGRSTIYFLKVNDKLVTLFLDNRGISIEMEEGLTKEEFLKIEIDLIKYLYSGYSEQWKNEMNLIMGR